MLEKFEEFKITLPVYIKGGNKKSGKVITSCEEDDEDGGI